MHKHLLAAMQAKNVSTLTVAQLIGTTEKTAYNKIRGYTEFTLGEAIKIKINMFSLYVYPFPTLTKPHYFQAFSPIHPKQFSFLSCTKVAPRAAGHSGSFSCLTISLHLPY